MTEQNTQQIEKSQSTSDLAIHDIITITSHQKTAENGKKKGYSWQAKDQVGLVVEVGPTRLKVKWPNGELEEYELDNEEDDYYYTFNRGSDVVYLDEIDKAISKEVRSKQEVEETIKKLMEWRHDFEHSFSFIGKLVRFIKGFSK